jgi:hypothetical protein
METIENYISILPTKTQKKKDTSILTLETAREYVATHRKLVTRVLLGMVTIVLGKKVLGSKKHKSVFISASSDSVSSANISTQHIRL